MTAAQPAPGGDSRYCGAKKRQGDGNCTRPAGWGTNHVGVGSCKLHGGKTRSHEIRGQVEMAKSAVQTFGLPREIDPRDALLEEVYRTAGAIDWLYAQIRELEPDAVVWGKTEEVDKGSGEFTGTDITHAAAVNVWVELWQKERKHLVDVSKAAISAGIEERRVKLAEQQGALLASVIKQILGDLNLTPTQHAAAPRIVSDRLRAVSMSLN